MVFSYDPAKDLSYGRFTRGLLNAGNVVDEDYVDPTEVLSAKVVQHVFCHVAYFGYDPSDELAVRIMDANETIFLTSLGSFSIYHN